MEDSAIYSLLRRVGIDSFVESLPDKLNTKVGEMGSRVSGGEKQRLSIARELAATPQILFLDEATSSIDADGESNIFKYLQDICRSYNMSLVFVTHYMSIVSFADLVYVMENGQICESGTLSELIRSGKIFRKLFYNQLITKSHNAIFLDKHNVLENDKCDVNIASELS